MVFQTKEALHHEEEMVKIAQSFSLDAYSLNREETEKLEPNVRYDMAGSVWFGCDAWMTPNAYMDKLKSLLVKRGVKFEFNTKLTDFSMENGRIKSIKTNKGTFEGDEFIVAAGAWTPLLMKKLGIFMPLQGGKGYSFTIDNPPTMPKLPSILVEGRIATTPMMHGLRIAGTMEFTGINHEINQNRIEGIIESVKKAMPGLRDYDFTQIKPWAGLRPCTPDGLPYIGRISSVENLQIGTGHAMLGWTLGPITGKMLAEEVMGEKASVKSSLLDVDRYS